MKNIIYAIFCFKTNTIIHTLVKPLGNQYLYTINPFNYSYN